MDQTNYLSYYNKVFLKIIKTLTAFVQKKLTQRNNKALFRVIIIKNSILAILIVSLQINQSAKLYFANR
jgi:hypothetical protein